jgi:hypothetical protein
MRGFYLQDLHGAVLRYRGSAIFCSALNKFHRFFKCPLFRLQGFAQYKKITSEGSYVTMIYSHVEPLPRCSQAGGIMTVIRVIGGGEKSIQTHAP